MKSKLSTTLGNLRRERKLSQREAAAELGVSQALLSHYENDAREPRIEFILKACDFYAVTSDFLIGRSEEREDGASRLSLKVNNALDVLDELRLKEGNIINSIRDLTTEE